MSETRTTNRMAKLEIDIQEKFYSKMSKSNQILKWYDLKNSYGHNIVKIKSLPPCIICSRIFRLARGVSGVGTNFYRDEDGNYIAECGGRDGRSVCPGLKIIPDGYIDRATITQEIHEAGDKLLGELKHIRDRVLALETITKEDGELFDELTDEYRAIRKIEDEHAKMIEKQEYKGSIYVYEEEEGDIFRSPMILSNDGKGGTLECRDMITTAICKEDLPVKIIE